MYVLCFVYVIGLGPPCGGSGIQHVNNGIDSYGVGLQLFLGRVSPSPPARASARAQSGKKKLKMFVLNIQYLKLLP
jgi:hypothetical protein